MLDAPSSSHYIRSLQDTKSKRFVLSDKHIYYTAHSIAKGVRRNDMLSNVTATRSGFLLLPHSFTDAPKLTSMAAEQTEKAFLKQPKVFLCSKKSGKGKAPGKGGNRYWKSIGLGFKTPREAIEGTYIDKKCPFTGSVSIRGRILAGTCHSAKMIRTIIVRRNYLHWVKKYQRYEKRHSNIAAHISPCFRVKEGDHVIIGQCRPLSKTVRFNVLKVIPAGSSGRGKKAFTGM
ncbi:40S ribosomal protein S11-3 [Striga hermonthica]|uniref:40S ribosomal protein S11-3 n=1 Tax=Striga hermonthica TaxID=68872 RepID=A0A9N7NCY5_STRHE|nr:40S ribosomal protein S11-3 [Striga hermonthica]